MARPKHANGGAPRRNSVGITWSGSWICTVWVRIRDTEEQTVWTATIDPQTYRIALVAHGIGHTPAARSAAHRRILAEVRERADINRRYRIARGGA